MIDIRVCLKTGYPKILMAYWHFTAKIAIWGIAWHSPFSNPSIRLSDFWSLCFALDRHTCDGHARVSQRNPMTGIERKVGPGLVCVSKAATDLTWSAFQHII